MDMIMRIMRLVEKSSREEVKISKGAAFIVVVGAFLIGIVMGTVCTSCRAKKRLMGRKGAPEVNSDSFDADEYVKSLNFEED